MKKLIVGIIVGLTLALASTAGAARPIGMSAQDPGGDSQCQNGTVLNWYSWKWYAYIDGGGYVRLWDDVYSCDGGHYVYVGGFWA